jgi:hypothetical protein
MKEPLLQGAALLITGGVLLSHTVSHAVPSALFSSASPATRENNTYITSIMTYFLRDLYHADFVKVNG